METKIKISSWNILAYIHDDEEYKWFHRLPLIIYRLQESSW